MSVAMEDGGQSFLVLQDTTNASHTKDGGDVDFLLSKEAIPNAPEDSPETPSETAEEKLAVTLEETNINGRALSEQNGQVARGEHEERHDNNEDNVEAAADSVPESDALAVVDSSNAPANDHAPLHGAHDSDTVDVAEPADEPFVALPADETQEEPSAATEELPMEPADPINEALSETGMPTQDVEEAESVEEVEAAVPASEELAPAEAVPADALPAAMEPEPASMPAEDPAVELAAPDEATLAEVSGPTAEGPPVELEPSIEAEEPTQTILADIVPAVDGDGDAVEKIILASQPTDVEDTPVVAVSQAVGESVQADAGEEDRAIEEVGPASEPTTIEDAPAAEEHAPVAEKSTAENIAVAGEDAPVVEESSAEDASIAEEVPAPQGNVTEEAPAAVSTAAVESEMVEEEAAAPIDEPATAEVVAVEPAAEESPATETETPAAEVAVVVEASAETQAIQDVSEAVVDVSAEGIPATEEGAPTTAEDVAVAEEDVPATEATTEEAIPASMEAVHIGDDPAALEAVPLEVVPDVEDLVPDIEESTALTEPVVEGLLSEEAAPEEMALAAEVVAEAEVVPEVVDVVGQEATAEPIAEQTAPPEEPVTVVKDVVEVVEQPVVELVEAPVEEVAAPEEVVAEEPVPASEEAPVAEASAEVVAEEVEPEIGAVATEDSVLAEEPAVAVVAPPEEITSESNLIEAATETPPGVEEVTEQEMFTAPDPAEEAEATVDVAVLSDGPPGDLAVPTELVEIAAPALAVAVSDEAAVVPKAIVGPAVIATTESVPSSEETVVEAVPTEAVADIVNPPVDNVVEAGNEAAEPSATEEHVAETIGAAVAAAAFAAAAIVKVVEEIPAEGAVTEADIPVQEAMVGPVVSEIDTASTGEAQPVEDVQMNTTEVGASAGQAALEAAVEAVIPETAMKPEVQATPEEFPEEPATVTVIVEGTKGELVVKQEVPDSTESAILAEVDRPKSPWTPSYSVTRQGSGTIAHEEVEDIEPLPVPVADVQTMPTDADATIAVPVILTEVVEEPVSDLPVAEATATESVEPTRSPSWVRSYSVSSQGTSPLHSPRVAAVQLEVVQATEDEQPSTKPSKAVEIASAEPAAPTAVESDVTVAAPVPVEVQVTNVETEVQHTPAGEEQQAALVTAFVTEVGAEAEAEPSAPEPVPEEAPKSPWIPSYLVSSQGASSLHKPETTDDDEVEEISALAEAPTNTHPVEIAPEETAEPVAVTVIVAAEEPQEPSAGPVVVLTSELEEALEVAASIPVEIAPVVVADIERPRSPWTPSYSVSRQGTSPVSPPVAGEEKELGHLEKSPAPFVPTVAVSLDSSTEDKAAEAPSEVIEPPSRPWTPSYSVTSQGPGTPGPKEEVVVEIQEPPPRPWTPSYSVTSQGPGIVDTEPVDEQVEQQEASVTADVTSQDAKHTFPTVENTTPSIASKPSLARLAPVNENEQLQTQPEARVQIDSPSPTTIRTRHESTTSSRYFPGGWFSSTPKLTEDLTSHENVEGEFLKSPNSAFSSSGLEAPTNTPVDGKIDERKGRWCIIM